MRSKSKGKMTMPREKRFIKLTKISMKRNEETGDFEEVLGPVYVNPDYIIMFDEYDDENVSAGHIPPSTKTIIFMSGGAIIYTITPSHTLSFIIGTREVKQ